MDRVWEREAKSKRVRGTNGDRDWVPLAIRKRRASCRLNLRNYLARYLALGVNPQRLEVTLSRRESLLRFSLSSSSSHLVLYSLIFQVDKDRDTLEISREYLAARILKTNSYLYTQRYITARSFILTLQNQKHSCSRNIFHAAHTLSRSVWPAWRFKGVLQSKITPFLLPIFSVYSKYASQTNGTIFIESKGIPPTRSYFWRKTDELSAR